MAVERAVVNSLSNNAFVTPSRVSGPMTMLTPFTLDGRFFGATDGTLWLMGIGIAGAVRAARRRRA